MVMTLEGSAHRIWLMGADDYSKTPLNRMNWIARIKSGPEGLMSEWQKTMKGSGKLGLRKDHIKHFIKNII